MAELVYVYSRHSEAADRLAGCSEEAGHSVRPVQVEGADGAPVEAQIIDPKELLHLLLAADLTVLW